jgi:hypothetical protein
MPPETLPLTPDLEALARQSVLGGAGVMPGHYALAVLAELDACRVERDRLALALDQARGVLRSVEWAGTAYLAESLFPMCPACDRMRSQGHAPACPLTRALSGPPTETAPAP